MQPTRCPACHGDQLAHGLLADGFVSFSFWKSAAVHFAACLACGAVTPYLDEAALNKMRGWADHATKERAFVDEL